MRRIVPRIALSADPREFVLAAVFFTITAVPFAGFGVTTLAGAAFDPGELRDATLAYPGARLGQVPGVRAAAVDRAPLVRAPRPARCAALRPAVDAAAAGALRLAAVDGDGRRPRRLPSPHGHADDAVDAPAFLIAATMAAAFAATALNALWAERRQMRISR